MARGFRSSSRRHRRLTSSREIESEYDLVLIDAPPVLRLAHSGTVVRLADRVMIVVAHRSDIDVADELQQLPERGRRARFLDTYTTSPRSGERCLHAAARRARRQRTGGIAPRWVTAGETGFEPHGYSDSGSQGPSPAFLFRRTSVQRERRA